MSADGTRTRIWTFTVLVRVNTGPPTWWLPNARIEFGRVTVLRFGWLRLAVQIGLGAGRHHEPDGDSR